MNGSSGSDCFCSAWYRGRQALVMVTSGGVPPTMAVTSFSQLPSPCATYSTSRFGYFALNDGSQALKKSPYVGSDRSHSDRLARSFVASGPAGADSFVLLAPQAPSQSTPPALATPAAVRRTSAAR